MELSAEQKKEVAAWVDAGAGLSEVQRRIESDWAIRMTYMDVRFLIDDLEVTLPEAPKPKEPKPKDSPGGGKEGLVNAAGRQIPGAGGAAAPGKVSVTVDKLPRPGSLVSGGVVFSDGTKASWMLDQYGRLGLDGVAPDYQPTEADMSAFQRELQNAARQLGL